MNGNGILLGWGLGLKVINHPRYPKQSYRWYFGGGSNVEPLRAFGFDGNWGVMASPETRKRWKKVNVKDCYSSRTSDRWFGVVDQKYTPEKQHVNGKITYSTWIIGYTSSNGWFSIVTLVFPGVYWSMEHVSTLLSGGDLSQQNLMLKAECFFLFLKQHVVTIPIGRERYRNAVTFGSLVVPSRCTLL